MIFLLRKDHFQQKHLGMYYVVTTMVAIQSSLQSTHRQQPELSYQPLLLPSPIGVLPPIACQICDSHWHSAHVCPQQSILAYTIDIVTTSFVVMPVYAPFDSNWVLNSGATLCMPPNAYILLSPQLDTGQTNGTNSSLQSQQ